jgi:hypothetical protein
VHRLSAAPLPGPGIGTGPPLAPPWIPDPYSAGTHHFPFGKKRIFMLNGLRRLSLIRIPVLVVVNMRPAISRGFLVRSAAEDRGRLVPGGRIGAIFSAFSSVKPRSSAEIRSPDPGKARNLTSVITFITPLYAGSTGCSRPPTCSWPGGAICRDQAAQTARRAASIGLQVFVQDLFYGAALIVAVSISMLARRRASASRLRRAARRSTVTPWRRPGS